MFPWFSLVLELIPRRSQNPCCTACFTCSSPQITFLNFRQGITIHRDLNVIKMLSTKDKIQPKFPNSSLGYILQTFHFPSPCLLHFSTFSITTSLPLPEEGAGTLWEPSEHLTLLNLPSPSLYNNKRSACHFTIPPCFFLSLSLYIYIYIYVQRPIQNTQAKCTVWVKCGIFQC